MAKNAINLGVGLTDNISGDLNRLTAKWRSRIRSLASAGAEMTHGLTLPLAAAGIGLVKFTADLDAMKRALAANMGSVKAANAEFIKLKELAKAPGISLEGAVKGSYTLQGLGASAEQARYQMEGLAKAVALSGGGEEQFQGLMTQFTQMIGSGKILQQDIRFMKENAPILSGIMADVFGTASPEKLRELYTVDEFVQKLQKHLHEMSGISGSVKNSLENLWNYFKIGVGEIGLAILAVTGFGSSLDDASDYVAELTGHIAKWIEHHAWLTKAILETLAAMAVTGPFIRIIANIGLIGTTAISAISAVSGLSKAIIGLNLIKLGAILGTIYAVGEALNFVSGQWTDFIHAVTGRKTLQEQMDDNLNELRKKQVTPMPKDGYKKSASYGLHPELIPGMGELANPVQMWPGGFIKPPGKEEDVDFIKRLVAKLAGEDGDKAKKKYKFEYGMDLGIPEHFPYAHAYSTDEDKPEAPDVSGFGKIFGKGAISNKEVQILEEYKKALKGVSIEEKLGATDKDALTLKMNAAGDAYRDLVTEYGMGSSVAKEMFDNWDNYKTLLEKITDDEKKALEVQEKKNKLLEQFTMIMDGTAEAFSGLVESGGGLKQFTKDLLKAASAMMKLVIIEAAKNILGSNPTFAGVVAAGIGAGILAGVMDGLVNSISMAHGGVIHGETMIRAGEYPGASGANPEVIGPLSEFKKMMGGMDNGIQVVSRIRGDEFLTFVSRAQQRGVRRGSGNIITL